MTTPALPIHTCGVFAHLEHLSLSLRLLHLFLRNLFAVPLHLTSLILAVQTLICCALATRPRLNAVLMSRPDVLSQNPRCVFAHMKDLSLLPVHLSHLPVHLSLLLIRLSHALPVPRHLISLILAVQTLICLSLIHI